jgi:hypothetical protein
MTEPLTPNPNDEPTADETFTWTGDDAPRTSGSTDSTGAGASTGKTGASGQANAILESLRGAVDDLAERATPAVRQISARAAELAAVAADRAAPLAKRAGEATSEASGKLAEKSRSWASDVRASMTQDEAHTAAPGTATRPAATATDVPPPSVPDAGRGPSDGSTPA